MFLKELLTRFIARVLVNYTIALYDLLFEC